MNEVSATSRARVLAAYERTRKSAKELCEAAAAALPVGSLVRLKQKRGGGEFWIELEVTGHNKAEYSNHAAGDVYGVNTRTGKHRTFSAYGAFKYGEVVFVRRGP